MAEQEQARLVLEDGTVFEGARFGGTREAIGEVVFCTSMTGYQEVLTDPSYAGQIVVLTYPLVGNYGVNPFDVESGRVQVAGFVVREASPTPSNGLSVGTIDEYLASQDVPGIAGVDTRAITRRLRSRGVMMGMLTSRPVEDAMRYLAAAPRYGDVDQVRLVTADKPYVWKGGPKGAPEPVRRILVSDCGVKYNILRLLRARGSEVVACPAGMSAADMLAMKPDGIMLSPGPGDPARLRDVVDETRKLIGRVPMMGICLGNQIVALALGGRTYKLKFGHRGGNHPVRDTRTGKVSITAQNHGYAVDADGLPRGLEVSHINLNDNTVEGLRHRDYPLMTIQYHAEASPGPRDNEGTFDEFVAMVDAGKRARV